MSTTYLEPALPWAGPQPEDHRYRRILATVLAVFVVAGAVVPMLRPPEAEPDAVPGLPPRLARIIAEPVALAPAQDAAPQKRAGVAPTRPQTPPRAEASPVQTPQAAPSDAARPPARRATESGVFALSDALAKLQRATPTLPASRPGPRSGSERRVPQESPDREHSLTAGVTRGSGGIGGAAPTPGGVLGAVGGSNGALENAPVDLGEGVLIRSTSPAASDLRGNRRSEEQIQEVLNRNKRAIYKIYNRELLADPTLQGKVVVSITIAPSGKVTDCDIVYSELGAATLEKQLVSLIKRLDFGAKAGVPPVTTRVPIEFFPV